MIRFAYSFVFCFLCLCSCKSDDSVRILTEDDRWQIRIDETDLFALDKSSGTETLLIQLCAGHCMYGSASDSAAIMVHKDSLCDVSKAHILSYPDESLVLLLQDISNNTVCHSFIFEQGTDTLIHLPSSGDFLGISSDNNLIIMDSYGYNDEGRYGVVQGYTFEGNKVCEMKTKK